MSMEIRAITPIVSLIIKGGVLIALVFGILGAVFIYLGSTGTTDLSLFGQTFKSQSVGISALFVSVVMFILVVRRALTTVDTVAGRESKEFVPELPEELLEKHGGNKVAATKELRQTMESR